ncbi:F-actin-monooxygenase MICAL2 isoform X18 [Anas platyrhynchos]|uniref:F-actin-monooxygenase MICAL2 isoform X18 n=1 Tax=Anas platyrhynchos TaxID=8839 RepID=UPI000F7C153B|nr:F-actin-monooxygenase MICAL2 isoform X16 [Anas platyrhynchos]|eukprot:XP_012953175.2 F-actin-monooxygenase MICAL2 isoform X7 [Anas platyrhynchos]
MEENNDEKYSHAGQIFENFVQASTCKGTIQAFNILTRQLELDPLDNRNFYTKLKSRVTTWKAKALWNKLDKRASHKEYKRGKSCMNTKCLIIGGGPCGLRTAIELAFLGAKVVVVEKRDTFSRNNVLHLWPFTIHDLRGLGAKKFYGKFCAGSIDHISIRQLQLILFKVALILGVEIHVNLEFVKVLEPPEDQENQKIGWRAEFLPVDHPLSEYEFDVVIGADGRRNTLEGFRRKEFRGKLAIAITANFINRNTTAEAKVEEISGVAFIFNQKFFQDLKEETGIDLENIVYYKDSTHYFVMTAKKQSLLDKGVIMNDYIDTELLLCGENVNQSNLLSYAREAADFATNYQLPSLDFAINHYGQPDVAMFDFTCMYASENAALVRERHRHQLLVALVGDSLLEPFWPMGTGCARGFLAAFDTAWMVRSWAQGKPPLEILAERESIYRLLPQTTPENINKNFDQYTIDPGTRYPNLNSSCVRPHQVRQLFVTSELQQCPFERVSSIRRSVNLSRRESDVRPNKLLTWCQKQTEGYRNVNVTDLTASWKSGLALCAIIHRFRPDLIDFDALNEEDVVKNNQLAFDVAEREFGIPPVTTGKEVGSAGEPDKLSMVMYLSKFYELFRGTPLRAVETGDKQNGENNDLCSAKSSNFIFNNYINLTLPRKRVPKVEGKTEENETNKRRRKGLFGAFEEASGFSSQATSAGKEQNDSKEGMNQNKVKSMATQLLAKFEENAPNTIFRRQGSLRKEFPQSIGGSDICYFCKKRVYVMERLSAEGYFFHRECFKCEICSTTLRLGIYAFDVEEGKFYCKPHFTHCKISNKHRKRRATLQVQGKEATEAWKKEEPKSTETTTESTLTTASNPEDRSPGCCQPVANEPTSPKKAKSILERHNLENWSPSPEWTTVRVIPEEEMTEHNLLAVRVMVTSDASSSELESEFNGDSSNSEVGEGETSLLELPACPSPPRRWASLSRSPVVPEESHKASKVADALQRANSFHSTALTKYQNWRRKIQTNFPLLSNKKPGLHWKESSASCQSDLREDQFQTQLTSYKNPPKVTRGHVQRYSPVSQRKEKVREMHEDVHLYMPHCPFQSRARGSPRIPRGNGTLTDDFLEPEDIDCHTGTCTGQSWNENKQNYTSESQGFNSNAKVLPCLCLKEKDEKNTRHPGEKFEQELKEAKKRLVLCTEQQRMLYDSNGVDLGGTRLQNQNKGVLGISEKDKDTDWRKGVFKQSHHLPLLFADDVPLALSVDMKGALKNPDTAAKEPTASQPKSPLRLIANAIKRSILEPLTSSTEGLKQDSDSKSKASSEKTYFSFPSTPGYSLSQRNSNNNRANNSQPQELKIGKQAGEYLGITCNSLSTPSNFSVSSEEISPSEYTKELFFPVYSPQSRPSKTTGIPQKSPCTRMEDVPGLLEKFTFKETPPVASRGDIFTCNKKYLLASSREPKNVPRDNLDDSTQKSSLGSLFDRLRSKVHEREGNFLVSSLPFMRDHSAEDRLHFPSAGCEHPTVRKEAAEYSTSSSEDEFELKPSLTHKAKMSLRRRRKLEKETKQLIKQEELKRLHKAQAVQRQLEELEERQRALEIFGVKLERELRGESADSGTQDETQMLHEWFELVLEKNKLMRYESELLIVAQELELEDHQSRLEQKLREKMAVDDTLKDEMDLNEEDEIFTEMMKTVEERDKLVSALEEQRVKEKAEDQHFESIIVSRGYQLSGI